MYLYKKERVAKFWFSLPTIVFFSIMIIFPILFTLVISTTNWTLSASLPDFVGMRNYLSLLHDTRFLNSLGRTLYFTITASVCETVLGIAFAVLLNRSFPGRNVVKTLFLLPFAATPVAVSMTWMLIFDPNLGVANTALAALGIPAQTWLASPDTALGCLIFVEIWQGTAIVTLLISAGLSTVPEDYYEAARIDGASSWQMFWRLTLPLLSGTILIAFIMRFVEVIKAFDIIYSTTNGGPMYATETLNIYGYLMAFQYFQFGSASALIVLFTVVVTLIGVCLLKVKKWTGEGLE